MDGAASAEKNDKRLFGFPGRVNAAKESNAPIFTAKQGQTFLIVFPSGRWLQNRHPVGAFQDNGRGWMPARFPVL
jgi:hypothetical protein